MNNLLNTQSSGFSRLHKLKRWSAVALLCTLCVACTNSRLILRPLYNGLDDRFEEPLFEHTKFNSQQSRDIKELMDHFHVWHRKTQLDRYALFFDEVVSHQKEDNGVTKSDIDRWSKTLNDYRENITSCLPFYRAAHIISTLTDQQLDEIIQHRLDVQERRRAARAAGLDDDDDDEFDVADTIPGRVKQIKRYLGLIGLDLNKTQLDDLRETMGTTIRSENSFREVREKLDQELFALMDIRTDPGWESKLVDHIDRRRQVFADRREVARNHNRGVWEAYALRTFQSFDVQQKQAIAKYLGGLSKTIKGLAADTPSYQKRTGAEYTCLGRRLG